MEAFPIPQEVSRLRWLGDHGRSLLHHRVYTRFVYESASFRQRLTVLLRGPWALIHADSLDLATYFPQLTTAPIACTHHDIQSVLLARRASVVDSALSRWYLRHQAGLMQAEEREWAAKVALNVVVSEPDAAALRGVAPGARIAVVPNGVDTSYFQPTPEQGSGLVFVGGSDWFPNRDGMGWFVREVLPLLRQQRPTLPVRWVGRVAEELRGELRAAGVEVPGHVEDIRPWLRDAACVIVPLRVGGGTRIKLLDAWAMGRPVVATTLGAEGLPGIDGESIVLADSATAFAGAVARVLDDSALRHRLGHAGRTIVERAHGWDEIGANLRAVYLTLRRGGN